MRGGALACHFNNKEIQMYRSRLSMVAVAAGAAALLAFVAYSSGADAQGNAMTFFVTSTNPGKGPPISAVCAGADQHCPGAGELRWCR